MRRDRYWQLSKHTPFRTILCRRIKVVEGKPGRGTAILELAFQSSAIIAAQKPASFDVDGVQDTPILGFAVTDGGTGGRWSGLCG